MKKEEDFEANLTGEDGNPGEMKSSWFKRIKKGILTSTKDKKDAPEGLWAKCPTCKYTCTISELEENTFVCPKCGYHHRIGSNEYFGILFFSPSAVQSFFSKNKVADKTILFAIGNTTANEIKKYSTNKIIISDEPGKENLVTKMIEYFNP